jgi:hypothetical protein
MARRLRASTAGGESSNSSSRSEPSGGGDSIGSGGGSGSESGGSSRNGRWHRRRSLSCSSLPLLLLDLFGATQVRGRNLSAPRCELSGEHELVSESSLRKLIVAEQDVLRAQSSTTQARSCSWVEDENLHDRLMAVMKM